MNHLLPFFTLQLFAESTQTEPENSAGEQNNENALAEPNSEKAPKDRAAETEREFEKLIKGEYADAFSKRTQKIIDSRFKKLKNAEARQEALEPLLSHLRERYPEKQPEDVNGLVERFLSEFNKEQAPLSSAVCEPTEDTLREKALLSEFSEKLMNEQAKKIAEGWKQEAGDLSQYYPDFSLPKEYRENPDFQRLLNLGVPVRKAYEVTHLEDILSQAMQYAAVTAGKQTAQTLRRQELRPQENSVLQRASSVQHTDVNQMTERDIKRILQEVSRGAKITF